MPESLSFQEFQDFIRAHYHRYDSHRGTGGTFLWLMEEVGELASALQKAAVERGEQQAAVEIVKSRPAPEGNQAELPPELQRNLEDEFADVLGWLSTLANMHGVDLEKAVRQKYLNRPDPGPHKS